MSKATLLDDDQNVLPVWCDHNLLGTGALYGQQGHPRRSDKITQITGQDASGCTERTATATRKASRIEPVIVIHHGLTEQEIQTYSNTTLCCMLRSTSEDPATNQH